VAADILQALADPTRRAIFERVAERGECSVSDLRAGLSVSQPAISQHLATLRRAGLVTDRKQGRHVFYRARPEGLRPLLNWIAYYQGFWQRRIEQLTSTLQEIDPHHDAG
jgi:DNA-binding transcriptional ArsR family regulator